VSHVSADVAEGELSKENYPSTMLSKTANTGLFWVFSKSFLCPGF